MSDFTNSGKLFKNRNKREGRRDPDYTSYPAAAHITCPHCSQMTPWKMAAWIKDGKIPGTKFMSIAFEIEKPKAPPAGLAAPDKTETENKPADGTIF